MANPKAMSSLTETQAAIVISMMPDDKYVISGPDGKPQISQEFLKYNGDWKHALNRFQDDLREGRFDLEWVAQAKKASEDRQKGKFDQHKDNAYEEFWGQKQMPVFSHTIKAKHTLITLSEMFNQQILRIDDIWTVSKDVQIGGKRGSTVLVEKVMKVYQALTTTVYYSG